MHNMTPWCSWEGLTTALITAALSPLQTVPSLNIAYTQEKGYVTADIAEKEKLTKLNLSGKL